ncbi:Sorting nexin-41 [Mycena kentingensis (nom. inval.)]|nr:Sorting nexin-41 [Mycena kentingensis (nom. inval.)]
MEDGPNPFAFDDDTDNTPSSPSHVNISDSPSPPVQPSRQLSPTAASPTSPFPASGSDRRPTASIVKSDFCCTRDRVLHSGDDIEILITDAQKTSVNSTSPYIVYVIQTGNAEARHRYSEFESLRLNLVKLYPTLIIPPIPSKQTIGDYAVKQAKAKEDAALIARRKRMLQTFLNRIARHPILSNDHVFHRFLDGEVSWNEVLNSPPISLLPKNVLKAPSHNPTDQNASPAYAVLPNPSAAHPLRQPDQRFMESEGFTNKFANHVSGPMEKVTRRTLKRWADQAQDHADLGAALNAFSLHETGELSSAIEKTGQAIDTTYMSTTKLLQELEQNWAEPLHEYSQFASIIKKLLAYRHQKHVQYEMTQDSLENKREQLEELEKSEREARRLEQALGRGRVASDPSAPTFEDRDEDGAQQTSHSAYLPPHPGPSPSKRRAPGMGLLNAISYTLHGMMDVDPETARRNGITKSRENISQLEDALHLAAQDLKYSSSTIQADLDRFQRQKVADLREMTISMARSHRDWCKKNLDAWEEAKREIAKMPSHPNQPPANDAVASTSSAPTPASTFAQKLQEHFPQFVRCNQDDLGDRRQVENLARKSLREGSSVVIDRTNFDATQRSHWIRIAAEFGTQVWVLVFDTPKAVCANRLRTRFNHPTIPDPADALDILERFSSQYRAPHQSEGYQRILYLPHAEQEMTYTPAAIESILCRIRDSPPVQPPVGPRLSPPASSAPYQRLRGHFNPPPRARGGIPRDTWVDGNAPTGRGLGATAWGQPTSSTRLRTGGSSEDAWPLPQATLKSPSSAPFVSGEKPIQQPPEEPKILESDPNSDSL